MNPPLQKFIQSYWFFLGLGIAIGVAAAYPPLGKKGGILRTGFPLKGLMEIEYTVSYAIVALIFVISGLSLKTQVLKKAFLSWKIHSITQLFSLGITPLIGYAIGSLLLLSSSFDPFLAKGLMAACSTPTTISSNVLMTRQAKGNEAAALTNAVIGNVLGVFISPLWMIALIGAGNGGTVNYGSIFFQLAVTVVVPFIVGQLCQVLFPKTVQKLVQHVPLAIVNSCFLLIMVWSVFCDTFSNEQIKSVQSLSIFYILLLDIALYCLFSVGVFYLSRIPWFKLEKEDIVAIVFCGATKTVALGIPILNIIYGQLPELGILTVPLLIYHAIQLIIGSFIVTYFRKRWIKITPNEEEVAL